MTATRKTSVYVLAVPAHIGMDKLLNAMIVQIDADPTIERAGAWPRDDKAVVMFRAEGDVAAKAAAERLGGNTLGSVLHTGLGVHKRTVATSTKEN